MLDICCQFFATLQHVGLLSFDMWGYDVFNYTQGLVETGMLDFICGFLLCSALNCVENMPNMFFPKEFFSWV